MTQQAIADALGVSKATVMRDCDELLQMKQLDDVPEQPLGRDHPAGGSWAASSVT